MTVLMFQGGSGGSNEEADESGCEGVHETSEVNFCGLINTTTNDGPLSQTNDAHPKKKRQDYTVYHDIYVIFVCLIAPIHGCIDYFKV